MTECAATVYAGRQKEGNGDLACVSLETGEVLGKS